MKKIKRRDFLKGVAGSAALLTLNAPIAEASTARKRGPEQVGILYDSTLCVGCNACMPACKKANNMDLDPTGGQDIWDNADDLSDDTLNIIKKFVDGTGVEKDKATNGFAFIKRQCLHCVDPGCVTACPVTALYKDEHTGIVKYNKDACIGCRYCQIACPYNIPKFEWDDWYPEIVKCQLCDHLVEQGGISACCSACPTGASLFGRVDDLLKESKRRLDMKPGVEYTFPVSSIDSGETQSHKAAHYVEHVYGENELGGTQVMYMSAVPFDKFGLSELPKHSYASIANGIQGTLYKSMILPVTVFSGLAYFVNKHKKMEEAEHGKSHANEEEGGKS
jgi:Fe-S-cluster-containing dehydrogenase component